MPGKVEICGVNTSRLKVLSQQEMTRLLHQVREGNEQAREQLIEGNLRLVLSVIQRFSGRGESPDDLFQVGCTEKRLCSWLWWAVSALSSPGWGKRE